MKLSTRLLLFLLPSVLVIMAGFAVWTVEERTRGETVEAERETLAYGSAVGLALGRAVQEVDSTALRRLLDGLTTTGPVYRLAVFDAGGRLSMTSSGLGPDVLPPADSLAVVLDQGRTLAFRPVDGAGDLHAVLHPIRGSDGRVLGAVEVVHQVGTLTAERTRTGQRSLVATFVLVVVLAGLTVWLVQRHVSAPLGRFVEVVRGVDLDDLSERVDEDQEAEELSALAVEFNGMIARLSRARAALVEEAQERVSLERKVQQSEKLAAVGTLAAGVAHQIAAPLNVIGGRAERLLADSELGEDERRHLRLIVEQIDRITRIIRTLLDFARSPQARVTNLELRQAIEASAAQLSSDLEDAGIRLELVVPKGLQVRSDPELLEEAVTILLDNAVQALRGYKGRRGIRVEADRAEEEVVIEIRDSGPGLPAERDRIFEPFFSTRPGGTGLGLAVARKVVEQMGGRLWAVDDNGDGAEDGGAPEYEGAVFRISLPRAAREGGADG